ncbi:MAG TPA: glycosyl hydrolase 53 family protein [Mycetocola sp.]|nr:glycosyl hydrolase 53 family protein [Mycetocola sp.]
MNDRTRRGVFVGAAASAIIATAGAFVFTASASEPTPPPDPGSEVSSSPSPSESTSLRIRGADVSFALQNEAAGIQVSDEGAVLPVERILANHGANYVRVRVWVDPSPETSDLSAGLELARRAKAAGLGTILNLHYSDTWADRSNQATPSDWRGEPLPELGKTVERYTRSVVNAFAAQGTPVAIVQVGNEITHGMLWPVGRVFSERGDDWTDFLELLRAGVTGALAANPANPPEIMIATDTGGNATASLDFFDRVVGAGIPFDLIGLSYYPFWNGPLSGLAKNLSKLATRFDKDILIAETSYPWTLDDGDDETNVVTSADQLPDAAAYPATRKGQREYFQALRDVVRGVPGGHGAGFLVWEPSWLPGVGADPRTGNAFDNLTMFDADGRALPSIEGFAEPGS